jgi:hypothetical protein
MLLQVISFLWVFLKYIGVNLALILYSQNIKFYSDNTIGVKDIAVISMMGLSFIVLVFLFYIQTCFFNLSIPNKNLPWAETSTIPHGLEFIIKAFLALASAFQDLRIIRISFVCLVILLQLYKMFLRLTRTQIMKK